MSEEVNITLDTTSEDVDVSVDGSAQEEIAVIIQTAESEADRAEAAADRAEETLQDLIDEVGEVSAIFTRLDGIDAELNALVSEDEEGLILTVPAPVSAPVS